MVQAPVQLEARPAAELRARIDLELAELKQATAVIVRNHYLHRGRTMGQIAYWVILDERVAGVLLYAYPRMSARFQGYGPMELLELARMWLQPSVQGMRVSDSKGREHAFPVATCAAGASLRRIRQDWHAKYPHLPDIQAVVSWADREHHEGTIYKAANFRDVGVSGGSLHGSTYRRNGGHDQLNPDYLHLKTGFIYEYRKPLKEPQKLAARSAWTGLKLRSNRVLSDELTEVQRGLALKAYPM